MWQWIFHTPSPTLCIPHVKCTPDDRKDLSFLDPAPSPARLDTHQLTLFFCSATLMRHLDKNSYLRPLNSDLINSKPVGPEYASSRHIYPIWRHHMTVNYQCDSSHDTMWYSEMTESWVFLTKIAIFWLNPVAHFPKLKLVLSIFISLLVPCKLKPQR